MEFLNRVLLQIKSQLSSLTLSQKMVIALLLAFLGISFFWMVNYSSERQRVPLLPQSLSEQNVQTIVKKLDEWGEEYVVSGERILVPKSRQRILLAKLGYAEALPQDTSVGWSLILEDSDMMVPDSVRQNRNTIVLQATLGQDIETWPGVRKARVVINKGDRRRLNNITPVASASVTIQTDGHPAPNKLVKATAAYISGAVNRLSPENVQVIVDGKHMPVMTDDTAGDSWAMKKEAEEYFRGKILEALPEGLREVSVVQVDVSIDKAKRTTRHTTYSEVDSWLAPIDETGREENSSTKEQQAEPGFIANGSSAADSGSATQSESSEENTRTNRPYAGGKEVVEEVGPGGVESKTATVLLPDSYFREMVKARQGDQAEPDEAEVAALISQELPKLKNVVMKAIGLDQAGQESQVEVNTYWAGALMAAANGTNQATQADTLGTITGMASRYGKHIAVSTLAMISLFMVLMMVKRSIGPADIGADEAAAMMGSGSLPDALGFEESNFEDGEGADGVLAGLEMDDSSIRMQQMMQQVRSMVTDSPEIATNLVSKWINQD